MSGEFLKQITYGERGDFIFWIAEGLPIFLWIFLIQKYYLAHGEYFKDSWVINALLLLPVMGIVYNIYMAVRTPGPTLPRAWDFCMYSKVAPKDKERGVVAYYDYDCYYGQNEDMRKSFQTFADRLYYINYILFFIIIIVQEHYKNAARKVKFPRSLINLLCIAGLLGVVGALIPLFTGNAIPTYISLKFFSGILWMSSTLLAIFLVDMYKFVNT